MRLPRSIRPTRDPVLCWLGVSAQLRFRQGPPRPPVSEIASSPTSPFLTFFEMFGSRGRPGFLDITLPPTSDPPAREGKGGGRCYSIDLMSAEKVGKP